ncbi:MAG: hypothetical protein GKR98_13675 [Boseongicola sp.]|nr:MAG: hypothetical protein GKR98_13675 [Boseongicola sp.]
MKFIQLLAAVGITAVLSACAQQPESIRPEPTFDKLGGGECEEGWVYIPGTAPRPPECIPEDDCDPITLADGSVVWDCPPPPPTRDRDRDDSSSSGGTTRPSTPGTPPGSTAPRV